MLCSRPARRNHDDKHEHDRIINDKHEHDRNINRTCRDVAFDIAASANNAIVITNVNNDLGRVGINRINFDKNIALCGTNCHNDSNKQFRFG